MSDDKIELSAADVPADVPSCDTIVQMCDDAGYCQNGLCIEVAGRSRFWVKYGAAITLGEARTQKQVAEIANADPEGVVGVPEVYLVFSRGNCRYIIMQHVEGVTIESRQSSSGKYAEDDLKAVVVAVEWLLTLRMPANTPPGPVGGGPIGHDFFLECRSTRVYPTVQHLQDQINKLVAPQGLSVDFSSEIKDGLVLCPSDIHPSNFMIDSSGRLFVIDFGRTGYMPPSYVTFSFRGAWEPFAQMVVRRVKFPQSSNVAAMRVAAGRLVVTGNNSLGIRT